MLVSATQCEVAISIYMFPPSWTSLPSYPSRLSQSIGFRSVNTFSLSLACPLASQLIFGGLNVIFSQKWLQPSHTFPWLGSMSPQYPENSCYNTCVVFGKKGKKSKLRVCLSYKLDFKDLSVVMFLWPNSGQNVVDDW